MIKILRSRIAAQDERAERREHHTDGAEQNADRQDGVVTPEARFCQTLHLWPRMRGSR